MNYYLNLELFPFQGNKNQKFGLLQALISVGAWKEAEKIIEALPEFYAVSQPTIALALQRLIHVTVEPLHRRLVTLRKVYCP